MRAVEITPVRAAGRPASSSSGPIPSPAAGEILIDVAAAGVNRPDVLQRLGKYPPPPGASDIPGLEVAGVVAAVGADVRGWSIGDPICALLAGGGYAERAAVPHEQCLPIPKGLTAIQAAGIPETFFTVWTNVFQRGRLKAGETILIHGGTSGIGTTAIQLAQRLRRARVHHRRQRREVRRGEAARRRRTRSTTAPRTGWPKRKARHRRPRRRSDPRHRRRRLHRAATSTCWSVEGRLVQIAFLKSAKAELDFSVMMRKRAVDHRLDAAAAHAGGEGRDRARAAGAACGRCSRAAPWRR